MIRFPLFRLLIPLVLLLFAVTQASANVTGIVRGVQQNPIAGALVTFTSEANPADTFSGYTNAAGRYDIAITALAVGDVQPAPFTLRQNHPNPFNPSTTITFSTAEPGVITLSVYNLLGQRVRTLVNGTVSDGEHTAVWDGRDDTGSPVGAGVYLYRLAGGGRAEVKKMLLIDGGSVSGWAAPALAFRAAEPTAVTWTVTITGDDIEPREMTGLEIADGGSYDFYVIYTVEPMNFHLVPIPGGTFEMGEEWEHTYELMMFGPAHQVILDDFEISAFEITNAQYAQYLNEALAAGEIEMINGDPYGRGGALNGKRLIDLDLDLPKMILPAYADQNCLIMYQNDSFKVEQANRYTWPVVAVTWYGAKAFATHYGLDLPTEAEWEYAAGGGTLEYAYATDDGSIDSTKANYMDNNLNDIDYLVEIGNYPPNPFGLYDMSGNVSEWCNDWSLVYPRDPYNPASPLSNEPVVNPTGPETGTSRIIRGGSYSDQSITCRTTDRGSNSPEGTYGGSNVVINFYGFRVARRQ